MKYILIILCFCSQLSSCSEKLDRTNPELVLKKYLQLKTEKKHEEAYKLLSKSSKDLFTYQDYLNYYKNDTSNYKIDTVIQFDFNSHFPNDRGFKVKFKKGEQNSKDKTLFFTVAKDSANWSVVWTNILEDEVKREMNNYNYSKSIGLLNLIVKTNYFNIDLFQKLGSCYDHINNYSQAEIYFKKALSFSKESDYYNSLANVYYYEDLNDLAIETYKKAFEIDKSTTSLNNIAMVYSSIKSFKLAREVLENSLKIDSTYTYTWYRKADLMMDLFEIDSAIIFYKKAIHFKPLENYYQKLIYYDYAKCLLKKAKTLNNNNAKNELLKEAKINILKALELDSKNKDYDETLKEINR